MNRFFIRQKSPSTFGIALGVMLFATSVVAYSVRGQGCIAVRGAGLCPLTNGGHPEDAHLASGDWLVSLGYRFLNSDRHFVGDREQTQRQDQGTEVINTSHFIDLGVQYAFTPRWSAGLTLPFAASDRSSLYEHKGNSSGERYHTQAGGLGDIRITGYGWLLNPTELPKGNVQLGVGFKAPTGESDATDLFNRQEGLTLDYVDQSIQPGDGGWGMTMEINAYYVVLPKTVAFAQAYYLANPGNINSTPTRIRNIDSTDPFTRMSISDQYFLRSGLSYTIVPKWGMSMSLAGRAEGIPVEDVIGDSQGFRRPGFTISVEPGLEIMKGPYTFNVSVPVALHRNRQQSVSDKLSDPPRHGDAAFADYAISTSLAYRF